MTMLKTMILWMTMAFQPSVTPVSSAPAPASFTFWVQNPVRDQLRMKIDSKIKQTATIEVIGLDGRALFNTQVALQQGLNEFNSPFRQMPGYYFVIVTTDFEIRSVKVVHR